VTFSQFGITLKLLEVPQAQLHSEGKFSLNSSSKLPYVIEISSIGFISKQVNITTNNQKVNIIQR
jgi:hypothetical protein